MKRLPLAEYTAFKNQCKFEELDFETWATSYSRKIKYDDTTVFFSEDQTNPAVMHLIKSVRKEADLFVLNSEKNGGEFETFNEHIQSYDILFSNFVDKPKNKDTRIITGWKIDLTSAYWRTALNMGIITEKTNDYFNAMDFGYDKFGAKRDAKKLRKGARLKALGALATRKVHDTYIKGELQSDLMEVIYNKLHRALYLNICEQVAKIMSIICYEFFDNVIYYYWDCVFIDDHINKDEIIARIKTLGYDCHLEGDKTEFEINRAKSAPSIIDKNSGKSYPIEPSEIIYY